MSSLQNQQETRNGKLFQNNLSSSTSNLTLEHQQQQHHHHQSIPRISNINLNPIDPKLQSNQTIKPSSSHQISKASFNRSNLKRPSTTQTQASFKESDQINLGRPRISSTDGFTLATPYEHPKPRQARLPTLTPQTIPNTTTSTSKSLPSLPNATVELSPASCMYWSKASIHGTKLIKPLRAHTSTLVNDSIWIFGGTDLVGCFKDVWKLDLETLSFNKLKCRGFDEDSNNSSNNNTHHHHSLDDLKLNGSHHRSNPPHSFMKPNPKDHLPPPCRAHSATHLDGRIFIFGGGDGPNYFDDLYYLDTVSLVWTKPRIEGTRPSTRRAHATVLYGNQLIIFGGGNGSRALNDVHALDLTDLNQLEWRELGIKGQSPLNRGYHSANLVGSKCVIFGGSDGGECFSDIHILDLENLTWIQVDVDLPMPRLAHTSTQVGSYLFIIGGHDGEDYTSEVKLFNLVTLQWEPRTVKGQAPPRIGYHTTTLHDSRLIVIGGFDGRQVFDQVWCLELASSAYLPQVTNFTIPIDEI